MAKNWGKTPVTNADNRVGQTQTKYLAPAVGPNGEDLGHDERIDRRPLGKAERFVDPQGNVTNQQMYTSGDPHRAQTEISKRAALHAKGFVEFAKCPLKHGTRHSGEQTRKDFAKMPVEHEGECKSDPKVMERKDGDLYALSSCKHIEWLIQYRRAQAAEAYAKRNAHTAEAKRREQEERELKAAQVELVKEQLAERKARKPKAKDITE
jgi:hypothetical protein